MGAFELFGGSFLVCGADLGVCHGGFRISSSFFEALAVFLLGCAPLYAGHFGEFDEGYFACMAAAEDGIAHFAQGVWRWGWEMLVGRPASNKSEYQHLKRTEPTSNGLQMRSLVVS